jgi:dGTP triphosphohydrolase
MAMQPLTDLINGLEILEPFLKQHGFEFNNFENVKDSRGQITVATYVKGQKKFIIGYRISIRQVVYQFDNSIVGHDFYLDQLGFADKKENPDILSDDKLLAFMNILKDFEFLVNDFFDGQCIKLKQFSKLQDNVITEHNKVAWEKYNFQLDRNIIETAREEFKKKNFQKSIETYKAVEQKNLLNNLDNRIIEYCERNIYSNACRTNIKTT